ncbi:transmembrane protein 243-like [Centruroides vittatus]|uniref:transmembrane protein 243-like n=1 Tax=Centruroides vittatus TaxID=120091 RepID=UPI00351099D4
MDARTTEYHSLFGNQITDRPLFGVSNRTDRVLNLIVGVFVGVLVAITLICAFVADKSNRGLDVFFAFCIVFVSASHLILIYWYRQGDIDPKFRYLIYYNAVTIMLLCICSLCYFFHKS